MSIDYERLFEAISSPHMVIDRNFDYVAVNSAYEQAVARSRNELVGRNVFDLFPNDGDSGQRLRESFDRVFETGRPDTLAFLPYDIERPTSHGGGIEQRFWTAVHTPLADDTRAVQYLVQNTVDVTEIARARHVYPLPFGASGGETRLLERAKEAEQQHQTLLSESEDFRRLFQLAPGFFAVLSGPEHVFVFANDAYTRLVGGRSVVGQAVRDALPEVEEQGFIDLLNSVYRTGKPAGGQGVQLMLQRAPDEPPRETHLDFSYDAIRDRGGQITGIFVQGMDRTEAVRTQQRQKLLLDELNHRVKNTLATVQSIASQTLRPTDDPAEARKRFEARLRALSNAHNLLSEKEWTSTTLETILKQELAVYESSRILVSGPTITLLPKASIAIALVVHELGTNAAKYGALSAADGRLSVRWWTGEDQLTLDWEENGGPTVHAPQNRGFGSRLIERVVSGELGGEIDARYGADGFACTISVPYATSAEHAA